MASFAHVVSWVAENLQRSYIPNARLPTLRIFNAYREYCAKNNIERPTPDTMIGKIIGKLYPGVKIKFIRGLEGRELGYEGLRLLSPEERQRCQELKVPEFCEWKILDGNFNIRIPKMDVCDGETVWFEYSVEGETGKLSLHIRNEEIKVLGFGFSSYVILDQVWINSIIRITDKMTLCKGCENETPFEPKSESVVTHYWNNLSGSPDDTFARLHFYKCRVLQSLWSYREHCADCVHHVHGLLKYLIIRHEEEQERITKGKGEPKVVTKSKKVRRKKRKHEHKNSECDCTKPKRSRRSKKVTAEPDSGLREVKVFEPGVFPVTVIKNNECTSDNTTVVPEERTVIDVVPKSEESVKNTGESVLEAHNVKSETELVPNKSTIVDVVPKTEEAIRNTELTSEEHCDPNGASDDADTESATFIPNVKPEIEHDSLVFLPQKSVLKVRTVEEVENTMIVTDGQVHSNVSAESDSQDESFSIVRRKQSQRKSVDTNTFEIHATVCLLCGIQFKSNAEAKVHALDHRQGKHLPQSDNNWCILPKLAECGMKNGKAETRQGIHQNVVGSVVADEKENAVDSQEATENVFPEHLQQHPIFDKIIQIPGGFKIIPMCILCRIQFKSDAEADLHALNHSRATSGSNSKCRVVLPSCGEKRKTHNMGVSTVALGDKSQSPVELQVNKVRLIVTKVSSKGVTSGPLEKEPTKMETVLNGAQQPCSSTSQQQLRGTEASVSQQQGMPGIQQPVLSIVQQQHQATENVTLGKQQNIATVLPSVIPHLQVEKSAMGLQSVFKPRKKQPNILCRSQDTDVNTKGIHKVNSSSQFENKELANVGIKIVPMCLECGLIFDSHCEAKIHKENHRKMLPLQPQSQPGQIIIQTTPTLQQTIPTISSGLPPLRPKPLLKLPGDPQPKKPRNSLPLLQPKPPVNQMVPIIIQMVPVLQPVSLNQETNVVECQNTFELSGNVIQPVPIVQCEPPSKVIKTEEYGQTSTSSIQTVSVLQPASLKNKMKTEM